MPAEYVVVEKASIDYRQQVLAHHAGFKYGYEIPDEDILVLTKCEMDSNLARDCYNHYLILKENRIVKVESNEGVYSFVQNLLKEG